MRKATDDAAQAARGLAAAMSDLLASQAWRTLIKAIAASEKAGAASKSQSLRQRLERAAKRQQRALRDR